MHTTVTSNGVPVSTDPEVFAPMRDSSALLSEPGALRERFVREGYVHLRGLLELGEVLRLRGDYFNRFEPGYLEPGTDPVEGIWSGAVPPGHLPHGVPGHPAYAFVRDRAFERFATDQRLIDLAELLLGGEEAMCLPRRIVRSFHAGPSSSRAHTDFAYLDQGSDHVVTMWIPLGDCPLETGGLTYLEGSHLLPPAEVAALRSWRTDRPGDPRPISHDLDWTRKRLGGRWLYADYAAGDVVVHSPYLVHASLDTASARMRLSADLRFAPITVEPDPRWLVPWSGNDGN